MIDIDMDFEKNLYEKLQSLKSITKTGSIEILYRLRKEGKIKIGDFSRKFRMHSETVKHASEILKDFELIVFQKDGRKKYLILTEKGIEITNNMDELHELIIE